MTIFVLHPQVSTGLVTVPIPTGEYFLPVASQSVGAVAPGQGSGRVAPWLNPVPQAIASISIDISIAGEAGSKLRPFIYGDSGGVYPGPLVYDAGALAADATGIVEVATPGLILPAGLLWVGGVSQLCPTTQPTPRTSSTSWTPGVPIATGTSAPAAAVITSGYNATGFVGAAPSVWPTAFSITTAVPRLIFKAG